MIKATITIEDNMDGIHFFNDEDKPENKIYWEQFGLKEQVRLLNALVNFYNLFSRHLKDKDESNGKQ